MKESRRRELDAPPEDIPQEEPIPPPAAEDVEIRILEDRAHYRACEEIQRATWGEDFEGRIPALILELHQKTGGLVGGAFDEERLVGFVFGFPALEDGLCYHWSHMLAVRGDRRGEGIGRRLKLFQRDRLRERGVDVACWTFDPMVARNAHLNLNRLGAEVLACVPDMYGNTGSPLHGELGTDRLLAFWELDGERAREAISGDRRVDFTPFARAPEVGRPDEQEGRDVVEGAADVAGGDATVSSPTGSGNDAGPDFPESQRVRIEIPPDLDQLREDDPGLLESWRARVRAALMHYLGRGYGVAALWRPPGTDRSAYCLESPDAGRRQGR